MAVITALDSGVSNSDPTTGGWVSGSVASLATSTLATVIFDLGTSWRMQRSCVVTGVGLTDSTSGTVAVSFASNAAGNQRVSNGTSPNSVAGKVVYNTTLSAFAVQLMVNDRYLVLAFTNGSTAAQSASAALRVICHDV